MYGIFGATPFEALHTLLLGIMKHTLECLFNYEKRSKSSVSSCSSIETVSIMLRVEDFERRVRRLSVASQRQSDRTCLRAIFHIGK